MNFLFMLTVLRQPETVIFEWGGPLVSSGWYLVRAYFDFLTSTMGYCAVPPELRSIPIRRGYGQTPYQPGLTVAGNGRSTWATG